MVDPQRGHYPNSFQRETLSAPYFVGVTTDWLFFCCLFHWIEFPEKPRHHQYMEYTVVDLGYFHFHYLECFHYLHYFHFHCLGYSVFIICIIPVSIMMGNQGDFWRLHYSCLMSSISHRNFSPNLQLVHVPWVI